MSEGPRSLGARSAEHADLPLQWMPHVQVADVAASAERALALGGTELMHGKSDDGTSQWAVLADPNGAAFGVIPVVPDEALSAGDVASRDGAAPVGRIAWLDLTVSAASATRDFYHQVVGWSAQDVEMGATSAPYSDYNMLAAWRTIPGRASTPGWGRPPHRLTLENPPGFPRFAGTPSDPIATSIHQPGLFTRLLGADGHPAAGICHARGVNQDLPPVWMIYLPVGDLAESLRRVGEEGGEVIKATRGSNGHYADAAIRDPVGAALFLVAT